MKTLLFAMVFFIAPVAYAAGPPKDIGSRGGCDRNASEGQGKGGGHSDGGGNRGGTGPSGPGPSDRRDAPSTPSSTAPAPSGPTPSSGPHLLSPDKFQMPGGPRISTPSSGPHLVEPRQMQMHGTPAISGPTSHGPSLNVSIPSFTVSPKTSEAIDRALEASRTASVKERAAMEAARKCIENSVKSGIDVVKLAKGIKNKYPSATIKAGVDLVKHGYEAAKNCPAPSKEAPDHRFSGGGASGSWGEKDSSGSLGDTIRAIQSGRESVRTKGEPIRGEVDLSRIPDEAVRSGPETIRQ